MYWGPDHVAIYNEAYILLAGQKHPALMGTSYKVAWAVSLNIIVHFDRPLLTLIGNMGSNLRCF